MYNFVCIYHFYTGLKSISLEYNGRELAKRITVYYDRDGTQILCEFKNVSPGDTIDCSGINHEYGSNGFDRRATFDIYYGGGNCIGRLRTDCKRQIIGESIPYCPELRVIGYIDNRLSYCNEQTWYNQESANQNNALMDNREELNDALDVFYAFDVWTQRAVYGIFIAFAVLSCIACYICCIKARYKKDKGDSRKTRKFHKRDQSEDVIAKEIAMMRARQNELEMRKALSGDDQLMSSPNKAISADASSDESDDSDNDIALPRMDTLKSNKGQYGEPNLQSPSHGSTQYLSPRSNKRTPSDKKTPSYKGGRIRLETIASIASNISPNTKARKMGISIGDESEFYANDVRQRSVRLPLKGLDEDGELVHNV